MPHFSNMSLPPLLCSKDHSAALDAMPPRPGGSACRECLGVPELFEMILHEVYRQGDGRGSLANVASTSKALYPGAIALLWREMDRLDPLLDLIPQDVWDYVQGEVDKEKAWHNVLRSSLTRVEWYGQYVNSVSWCSAEDWDFPQSSRFELLMHLPDDVRLLPNVRSFAWTERRPAPSPTFLNSKIFANSDLQELVLNMDLTDVLSLADILDVIRRQCPRLAILQLVGDVDAPLDVAVSGALADLVRSTDLTHFTCTCPLYDEVFLAVAQSTSLRYVAIRLGWYTLDSMTLRLLPSRCFTSVQDLSLQFEVLGTSSLALLKRLTSDRLASLALHVVSEDYDDDLLIDHLDVLASAPFAPTLQKFELHAWQTGTQADADDTTPCTVTLNTLRPLLRLQQLTHFIVHAKNFSLTSQDVREIASAFPSLDTLELMPSLVLGTEPPADALLHLAELCSRLTLVALPITTTFGVPRVEEGWKSKSPVTMYTIVTSQDLSGDPRLSSYISALFPASPLEDMHPGLDVVGEFQESYAEERRKLQV